MAGLTYSRYHFDTENRGLLAYTKAILEKNYKRKIKLARDDVNHFFVQNVNKIYNEGEEQKAKLLQQVSSKHESISIL